MIEAEARVLQLEGVHNFRDFGGYAVAGGGRVRRGLLWRSGQHAEASDADLARINALGLVAVFDLRTDIERASHPCRRPAGFAAKVYHNADSPETMRRAQAGSGQVVAHDAAALAAAATGAGSGGGSGAQGADGLRPSMRDAASTREQMRRNYATIAFRPGLVAAMRGYLEVLAQGGGASLVNCMAGKDRTGITVAMLLRTLGVHPDDIMADYLLTNTAGDVAARIEAGHRAMKGRTGEIDPEALKVLMGVEPEYLDTAFAAIAERYGSVDAYLDEMLGADDAMREALRQKLVQG